MLFLYAGQNSGFLSEFLQQLINGLSLGSIYALIALGYTMVYGIVKLINFAHGDVMMKTADFLAGLYGDIIDRSLLLAGTFLHDFAKESEFTFSQLGLVTEYSVKGQLLGHLS